MSERPLLTEINAGQEILAVTFTANGEHLVSGGRVGVCVWRVPDGEKVATMGAEGSQVSCLAASKDGKWIAAGTVGSQVIVWHANTHTQVCRHTFLTPDPGSVRAVDFSHDSACLIASHRNTAAIWDIAARQRVRTLDHGEGLVVAAKYSPQGDRIATASAQKYVRVWDSSSGQLLVSVRVKVTPIANTGLLWFNSHIFVVSGDKIKQIDPSTGVEIAEWPVPHTDYTSCLAVPQHGKFVLYSGMDGIRFQRTSTQSQPHLVHEYHHSDTSSLITFSSDDQFLATAARDGRITIKHVSLITVCVIDYLIASDSERMLPTNPPSNYLFTQDRIPLSHVYPTFQDPDIHIEQAALDSWKHGRLEDAQGILTAAIPSSDNTVHHVLASRALVRARLGQWDAAIVDAEQSVKIEPSVIGYIAKFVVLVGNRKMHEGHRVCDIAFDHFHSTHVTILLLIKAVVVFMAGEYDDGMSRLDDLIPTVLFDSTFHVVKAYMYFLLGNSQMEKGDHERAMQLFNQARIQIDNRASQPPLVVSLISGWNFDDLAITVEQHRCEALYAAGYMQEAADSLLCLVSRKANMTRTTVTRVVDLIERCLSALENGSNMNQDTACHTNFTPVLRKSLDPLSSLALLEKWAELKLMTGSWGDALRDSIDFTHARVETYKAICKRLEDVNSVVDAVLCFHQMTRELAYKDEPSRANWIVDFQLRCCSKLEEIGNVAVGACDYAKAIRHYTCALTVHPTSPHDLFVKRSKAHAREGMWEDALNDANEAIRLDPSSPLGYERKHAALWGAGRYSDSSEAFETMLLKMSQSSKLEVRELSRQYVRPEQTRAAIRTAIEKSIQESPLVLINTTSGRLSDKSEQAVAFESLPAFTELVASMTAHIDHARIEREVGTYYRYAMFSHKWEENEPLYEKVVNVAVYDLEESPTHQKLRMFCEAVREAGIHWAWSDTCCINKADHIVLQEALVSMFKWYQGSAMTIIFLFDVPRLSERGALTRSTWNTRGWTLQEYHASKLVRFYTQDWTPYLNLDIHNHKESPEIISEMEEATGISAQALTALRPGLDDIRGKLQLASTRETTRVEDTAYSLLGIFSMSLPVVYGEGDKALGRLLAQLLTNSGDASILAWTSRSGTFNSCLPADIVVFSQLPTSHIPPVTVDSTIAKFDASSLNPTSITRLYDQVDDLPVASFAGQRMRLPCFTFKLGRVSASRNGPERVFRAQTTALGTVEIRTQEDLSRFDSLCLIHPWIDFLLDRQPIGDMMETIHGDNATDYQSFVLSELSPFSSVSHASSPSMRAWAARLGHPFWERMDESAGERASLLPPSTVSSMEKQSRALQFIARLRLPFGALLLAQTRQHMVEYRRVAADTLITVQVEEITPVVLDKLMQSVRILDIL